MTDDRGLRTLRSDLQPFAAALLQVLRQYQPGIYITSGKRSTRDQERAYVRFQAGLSPYPAAPPGRSKHEQGIAFDLGTADPRLLRAAGKLWESWGGRWGGRFKPLADIIHFEG